MALHTIKVSIVPPDGHEDFYQTFDVRVNTGVINAMPNDPIVEIIRDTDPNNTTKFQWTGVTLGSMANEIAPEKILMAPILMFESGSIRFQGLTEDGEKIFQGFVPYKIEGVAPEIPPASTWNYDKDPAECKLSIDDIVNEKWEYQDHEFSIVTLSTDLNFAMELIIQKAVNRETGEPLTAYPTRGYGLKSFAIFFPKNENNPIDQVRQKEQLIMSILAQKKKEEDQAVENP